LLPFFSNLILAKRKEDFFMSMNKRAKRFFSFILAIIMLIPNLTVFPVSVMAATEYYNSQKLRTENSAGKGVIISINGSNDTANFAPTQVVWDNPVTKVSYRRIALILLIPVMVMQGLTI